MPDLNSSLYTDMLRSSARGRSLPRRLFGAIRREFTSKPLYGLEWGDPETVEPLRFIRDRWVIPYVRPDYTALEIGPGGGRWTRYLLQFKRLYVVDFHQELSSELRKNFHRPNMVFIRNNGTDFPGVPDRAVDYVFSFDTFVHLDPPLIEAYLGNLKRIVSPGGNVVLHYSDKTKPMAQENPTFSANDPIKMRAMVAAAGFQVAEEDLTTMWHSSLIRLTH